MVETPVFKLARVLGGVALMQGRLGHQVLGELLIAGTNELALAAAAVVVAGSIQQRNTAAQVALRAAAPAIALSALFDRREQILLRHERSLQPREKALAAREFELAALEQKNRDLEREKASLEGLLEMEKTSHERMRKVLGGVNVRLRAHEPAATPDTSGEPPVVEGPRAPKKRTAPRGRGRAKKRDKKPEQ
jgi:hypothetical protein